MALDLEFSVAAGVTTAILLLILSYKLLLQSFLYWNKRGVPQVGALEVNTRFKDALLSRIHISQVFAFIYKDLEDHDFGGFYKLFSPCLMIRDPKVIKTILVKEFDSFHDNESQVKLESDVLAGGSPFFCSGDKWKESRSQLTPALTSSRIRGMIPFMLEVCKDLKNYLDREISKGPLEAKDVAARYTTDNLASCEFGIHGRALSDEDDTLRKLGKEIFDPSFLTNIKFVLQFYFPCICNILKLRIFSKEFHKFFKKFVTEAVSKREISGVTRNDFLQILLQLKQKGEIDSEENSNENDHKRKFVSYSEQSLLSHAATLFVEGYETSSIVMSYTLFELAVNPDIQERVRAEIEESKGEMTLETISKMSYLDKVLSEVMRKYPVTSTMAKVCTKPCQLKSPSGLTCDVEVGTSVIIPLLALHHDPKHYPDPERFDPERFNEENIAKRHRFAYLPFGEGPRICIGIKFALAQIKLALVTIILHYKVSVNKKTTLPLTMDKRSLLTYPTGGLWLNFNRRNQHDPVNQWLSN